MAKAEATVEELVGMIQRGELRLPEMQRRYVWRAPRVRDLLDSLYRGYPSGAILLWETDEDVPLQEFAVTQDANPFASTRLLLDGQQRLTSLSAVIRGEPVTVRGRQRPIELLFNLEHPDQLAVVTEVNEDGEDDEEVADDDVDADEETADSDEDELQRRFERMTFVVATKKLQALPHWVKVSDVFKTNEDAPFLQRAGIESFSDARYTKYSQRLSRLRDIRRYSYRMDVLERSMTYDEVTEIFVRVNSLGAKLRSSDLALAQITAKWPGSLTKFQDFEATCAKAGFELELGIHLKNLVAFATGQSRFLTVGSLPRERLEESWEQCKRGMEFALNFLKSNAGIDSPALLSSPFIVVSLAYFGHIRGYEIGAEEAHRLRYWVLTANAKGRYSRGSSETLLDQDLTTIRGGGDADDLVDRLRLQVGRLDVRPEELAGRNRRSALFKTMFLAFRDHGARDWSSNLAIAIDHSGASDRLQFHHIFPKALLRDSGRTPREADDIANLAFISGKTNRKISDTPPEVYIKTLREKKGDETLRTQCVPLDEELLEVGQYDTFLSRRRDLIADCLNAFLGPDREGGAPWERDPMLRTLDERVEEVELRLRELIASTLEGNHSALPPHVQQKITERVTTAARKNPTIEATTQSLEAKLSYCDLRELLDVITSKQIWPCMEARFGTKEVLAARGSQLAELRNTIRHSRA
ncbi:MAG: DUF262 domain-containing protein, partial [Thermoanaerobaculia bacterium]